MTSGYGQFCPIAKGAEIVATRWTPLVLRELMCGACTFNDIHRGVPLMSRALLSERLRQLEGDGIIVRKSRRDGHGHDYWLTEAGEALRPMLDALGCWGLAYGRQRLEAGDRDSGVLMWWLRRRIKLDVLPLRRVVIRFELAGVARSRTGVQLYWLVLERSGVDVCQKDPGYTVDVSIACDIATLIAVYLGHATWERARRRDVRVTGDPALLRDVVKRLRLDEVVGRDMPVIPSAA